MLQRILGELTGALMAASFSGNNSSASPLEDSLAVPPEHRRGIVRSHPAAARRMMRGQATWRGIVEAARRLFSECREATWLQHRKPAQLQHRALGRCTRS